MHRLQLPNSLGGSPLVLAALVGVGLAAGAFVAWGNTNSDVALTVAMAFVSLTPIVIRAVQGKWDPFEPITILAVCIFVLFVIRPTAELLNEPGDYVAFDRDPRSGYSGAMVIALVGAFGMYLGYFISTGRLISERVRTLPERWDTQRSIRFTIYLLLFAGLMTAVFAVAIGGPGALFRFYLGRTATDFQQYLQSAAYFALSPYMAIPAMLILYMAWRRERTPLRTLLFFGIVLLVAFVTIPRGDRTYVIAWVMPLLILPYLRKDRRPSLLTLGAVLGVAIIALNVLIALRHVDRRDTLGVETTITDSLTHPTRELEEFVTGIDIAEFTVMELQYRATADGDLPFAPGATALSVIAGPIPGKIIGDKPEPGAKVATDYLFPVNQRNAIFTNSLFGDLYADWGLPTVFLYTFLFGVAVRFLWEYFLRNRHSEGMQIIFAATLPLFIILMRDNFSLTFGRALFLIFPLVLCLMLCGVRSGAQAPARKRVPAFAQPSSR
jgi:hypothetical protein